MATENSFSIGQVVYILSNKGQSIVPALVIEEAIIQTLSGKKVSWKFAIGAPGPKQKVLNSNEIDGEVYVSLEEVKSLLTSRLSKFIDGLLTQAKKYEETWYGSELRKAKEAGAVPNQPTKIDPQSFLDGMPLTNEDYFANPVSSDPKEAARQKLREMVAAAPDESEDDGETATYIENGVKVRVQIQ